MTPTHEETRLWIAINLAHRKIHREMERALALAGLPPLKWYDVLWAVEVAGHEGVRASALKDWLLFEQSNLSRVLAKLVGDGLIRETVCGQDRRAKTLTITDKGADLRLKMWEIYGQQIHQHMKWLSDDQSTTELLDAFQLLQAFKK